MKIVLKSSDNQEFEVDRGVIRLSTTLNNMSQDLGMDDPVILPNVKGTVLNKVIQWCQHDEDFDVEDGISDWTKEFLQSCQTVLFDLILAANYLDIPGLLELLRNSTFTMIKTEYRGAFKPIEDYTPFDDSHYGQTDELGREQLLIENERKFEDLYDLTARLLVPQIKYSSIYDTFPLFKKRIFHHYFRAFERFLLDPLAEVGYVSRITVLHLCCNLADIQNEELHKNDCWIASKKLEVKGRDRPMVTIDSKKGSILIAFRLLGKMRYGLQAFPDTCIEASHLCGLNDCIRDDHCVPESGLVNKSRDKCHKSGCAKTCSHQPRCLFQRAGLHLPCRSNPELDKCECDLKCFIGVLRRKNRKKSSLANAKLVEEESDEKSKWTPLKATLTDDMIVGPNLKFNGYSYSLSATSMTNIQDPKTGEKRKPKAAEVDKKNANWKCSKQKKGCNGRAVTGGGIVFETVPHTCK
ncbi:Skp1-related protein [Aphelenchoides bicaudatus]|nr:Skp1-related protein [Aphelenchoides bicaudatus]